jgi:hypothetical protein
MLPIQDHHFPELALRTVTFRQWFRKQVLRRKAVIPDKEQMDIYGREKRFADRAEFRDLVAIAEFVETLFHSEQQWIMNRLQWLFTSQSFLLTAYGVLVTRPAENADSQPVAKLLIAVLPWIGMCFCTFVGAAVLAAECVLSPLAEKRQCLTVLINEHPKMPSPDDGQKLQIPKVGTRGRHRPWTRYVGALPHWFLPWILALLWLSLGSHPAWLLTRLGPFHSGPFVVRRP